MKKAYAKPTATKVDFEYKDNVTAESGGGNIGSHASPSHPTYCQFHSVNDCFTVYNSELNCTVIV